MRSQIRYASVFLGPALMAAVLAQAAPVYKHIDDEGNVSYSEVPPPGEEDVETVTVQPGLPAGRQESAQERLQRMQEMSFEFEESRRERENTRTEQRSAQPAPQPPTVWPGDRTSDRYPDRYFPQRPPVGVSPPIAVPPIELPEDPGGGVGEGPTFE